MSTWREPYTGPQRDVQLAPPSARCRGGDPPLLTGQAGALGLAPKQHRDDAEHREAGHQRRDLVEAAAECANHQSRDQRPEAGDDAGRAGAEPHRGRADMRREQFGQIDREVRKTFRTQRSRTPAARTDTRDNTFRGRDTASGPPRSFRYCRVRWWRGGRANRRQNRNRYTRRCRRCSTPSCRC